jgi:putative oxidoreductase|tara:strand:+ start:1302 stop:1760 length:459 start_codon:yes stop_codon:yes gene_type:complete
MWVSQNSSLRHSSVIANRTLDANDMNALKTYLPTVGRIFLALIFILAGLGKITAIEGNVGYMEMFGVPGFLIWPTIIVEVVGGVMLAAGYKTRWAAAALGGFTFIAALIFHTDFSNQMEMTNFLKNLAITGGMLYVIAFGPGALAVDMRKEA